MYESLSVQPRVACSFVLRFNSLPDRALPATMLDSPCRQPYLPWKRICQTIDVAASRDLLWVPRHRPQCGSKLEPPAPSQNQKMTDVDRNLRKKKRIFGWIGTICLLLIIPIKLLRISDVHAIALVIGVAPSILGPAGLLFLLLSSTGRLSRLTVFQTTLLAGVIAVGLELIQLLPRPGILAHVRYTFDLLDLGATILSLVVAYGVARVMLGKATMLA